MIMEQQINEKEKNLSEENEADKSISIDDFLKVDLRIAKIIEAKNVEGADKLVQVTLDIGERTLNVFAGIKKHYSPEQLLGKKVVACVNLKPRKMKFGTSEAMMLAASNNDDLSMLVLDKELEAGAKIS
jgi:methionyl-tRNA synthetase